MSETRWSAVKAKIKDLIVAHQQLKQENDALLSTVESLKEELAVANERINQAPQTNSHPEFELLKTQLLRKDLMLQKLEEERDNEKQQISELQESVLHHESMLQVQKNTINELTEQNKMIKLAKEMSVNKADTHELKIKINELIRDIDRCIDLLND